MKGWLARAQANTVLRGHAATGPTRVARWSRWIGRMPVVPESSFQGPDEPYPRHWRHFPSAWPPAAPEQVRRRLRAALDGLPSTWHAVVAGHDVAHRSDPDIAGELGLSEAQTRSILARARASLRDQLDDRLGRGSSDR